MKTVEAAEHGFLCQFVGGTPREEFCSLFSSPQDDTPIQVGARVMVQTAGAYRRVLPAQNLPTKIKRPKKIQVQD